MKPSNKQIILGVVVLVLIAVAAVAGWRVLRDRQYAQSGQKNPVQSTDNVEDMSATSESDDVSTWKTYRNEKYGFEFKLSDEYSVPENMKNQVRTEGDVVYLDPQKTEYMFNSRRGLKISDPSLGGGDAADFWTVKVTILSYSSEFESDFINWLRKTHDVSLYGDTKDGDARVVALPSGQKIHSFCWVSIGSDCSAFFTDKKSIIELNTLGTDFFDNGKYDYFSSILSTFRFLRGV